MRRQKVRFVSKYPVKQYQCGLKAGDSVMLTRRIVVKNHLGKPTKTIYEKGEIWTVLQGTKKVLWLRQPDGDVHTWDDDESVYENFRKVETSKAKSRIAPKSK